MNVCQIYSAAFAWAGWMPSGPTPAKWLEVERVTSAAPVNCVPGERKMQLDPCR